MSDVYDLWCPLCEMRGPRVRRQAGATLLADYAGTGAGSNDWTAFLLEHIYHGPLVLTHENDHGTPTEVRYREVP